MSSKPKYYYELSIYDTAKSKNEGEVCSAKPRGWYFPLGLGKHILSVFYSSKTNANKLTAKGGDLLQHTSSLEGKLKLGFIASCTCIGGVVSLALRPPGRIRKLFYPTVFLATSSAICYPSTAYTITKTAAVITYNGGLKSYSGIKVVADKISDWRSARKVREEERSNAKRIETLVDMAPMKKNAAADYVFPEDAIMTKAVQPEVSNPNTARQHSQTEKMMFTENKAPVDDVSPEDATMNELEPAQSEASSPNVAEQLTAEDKDKPFNIQTLLSLIEPIGQEKSDTDGGEVSDEHIAEDSIQDPGQSSKEDSDLYTTRS